MTPKPQANGLDEIIKGRNSIMRDIKFRYWSTITNKMVNNPKMPHKEDWTVKQLFEDRGWIWQQFTGLTDKAGVEIYEGDIIDDGKGAGVVEFCEPIAAFVVRPVEKTKHEVYQLNKGNTVASTQLVESEVIGNIYENPELLTKEDK